MSRTKGMRDEYDFSGGERGRYAKAAEEGTNIIRLDADVAEVFHDPKQINDLLRSLAKIVKKTG